MSYAFSPVVGIGTPPPPHPRPGEGVSIRTRWQNFSTNENLKHLFCLTAVQDFIDFAKLLTTRVSSKQTKINFGSNLNKPKQDLFRVCFGLFRETKNKTFRFVSVFRTYIETTETNRSVSHQTQTNLNNLKFYEKYPNILSFKLFGWVFCFETNRKNEKTKKSEKKRKNPKFFARFGMWRSFAKNLF